MKRLLSFLFIFIAGPWLFGATQTDVYIGITSHGDKRVPTIGMPAFSVSAPELTEQAQQVHDVIRGDLLFARYFDVSEDGPEVTTQNLTQALSQWGKARASYVLTGDISYTEPYYTIKIYVYDISTRTSVFAKAFKGKEEKQGILWATQERLSPFWAIFLLSPQSTVEESATHF